ncbi:hypothetical protein GDO78_004430 [Eleutherodactylus coqui]|uniref:Uncharacterized protein n=1 Tax=Eleutherodactylus coqui TaxID=57060 RepID=A0A8J6ESE6_ELECQ|nr:hypothetical protein GDO78_004430 [Eleutherodactylus coqui]
MSRHYIVILSGIFLFLFPFNQYLKKRKYLLTDSHRGGTIDPAKKGEVSVKAKLALASHIYTLLTLPRFNQEDVCLLLFFFLHTLIPQPPRPFSVSPADLTDSLRKMNLELYINGFSFLTGRKNGRKMISTDKDQCFKVDRRERQ